MTLALSFLLALLVSATLVPLGRTIAFRLGYVVPANDRRPSPKPKALFGGAAIALTLFGSPVVPMHMALHAIPLQFAVAFGIPLILWGENSAYEYGSEDQALVGVRLTSAWLKRHGVTCGTTAEDWVDGELTVADLVPYSWPSDEAQERAGVRAVFLGHYFRWDPQHTFEVAKSRGFTADERPRTGYYNFADIDDDFLITIHHWMKWYKFGFTRLWDNLSLEIRNGRMTRQNAVEIVAARRNEVPYAEIARFCEYVGIAETRFFEIAERFRNRDIWKIGPDGAWHLEGFLVERWDWISAT